MAQQKIDLQELADLPGFGKAQEKLRALGCWDEHANPDKSTHKYSVQVHAEFKATIWVDVCACNQIEAKELAELEARKMQAFDWDFDDPIDIFSDHVRKLK